MTDTKQTIQNWSLCEPKRVLVQGAQFRDKDTGLFKYRPIIGFFLSLGEDPLVMMMYLDAMYDSPVDLARETVIWANKMWTNVSVIVNILDMEDGSVIISHNVEELLKRDIAIMEYSEILRTDTTQIH